MKAQASRTPETNLNPTDQVTPVIVKIGGGDAITDSDNTMIMNISSTMAFSDESIDKSGDKWMVSTSTKTGRIHELSIQDGNWSGTFCTVFPQPDVLTSLEVTFAPNETLTISEVNPAEDTYLLRVQTSLTPFKINDPAVGGGWNGSDAKFTTSAPVSLLFSQSSNNGGDPIFQFEYTFNNTSQSFFNLDFHVDRGQ